MIQPGSASGDSTVLHESVPELAQEIEQLRHALHRDPEEGNYLPKTQQKILNAISDLPLEIHVGSELSSVVAVIRGQGVVGSSRHTVLLRSDMDALPILEDSGEEFSSEVEGSMHACGHDLHMAMLVGAARLLCTRRGDLKGDVILMFQPGEEGHRGAEFMLNEGVLRASGNPVVAAYALHVFASEGRVGQFFTRGGPFMSASDELHVEVLGEGGHGSTPHKGKDVIPASCEIVSALQGMVTRQFNVFDPVVVSVGSIHAGTKANVIAAHADLKITLRSFSPDTRTRVVDSATKLIEGIGKAHGLGVKVHRMNGFPATVNATAESEFVAHVARSLYGDDDFVEWPHSLAGSEDFSHVLNEVPGCFIGLSAARPRKDGTLADNHSPNVVFDESVLPKGAELLANLALRRLNRTGE